MSVTNINIEFRHLAGEHDGFLDNNHKNFSEKQNLEAIVNEFRPMCKIPKPSRS
jgi:hypothetical protein